MTNRTAIPRLKFQSTPSGGKATLVTTMRLLDDSEFQSTPSGGKATGATWRSSHTSVRFNPRLPGGRRLNCSSRSHESERFQSTPSGGKATVSQLRCGLRLFGFQSTPSGGKATKHPRYRDARAVVSIHAFRGEGDWKRSKCGAAFGGFNPRLPGGRRPHRTDRAVQSRQFQSTPSGGKATRTSSCPPHRQSRFNPRLPGGRRRYFRVPDGTVFRFQSTPSGGKATQT